MARSGMERLNLGFLTRLRLGWRLLRDPRVPAWPKLLAPVVTVLYVLSPVDVIPDFIPVLGELDDLGVIALALAVVAMLARWSPAEIVRQHLAALGLAEAPVWERQRPGRATPEEPIEATYWVDDWR